MAETEGAAETLAVLLKKLGKTVVLAESCTAGLAADLIARVPGASAALWGSFVTYAAEAKIQMLGVGKDTLTRYGAVSRETAGAMASGALEKSGADFALSVTGLAGPQGDRYGVPVGTVWIGLAGRGKEPRTELFCFSGSRNAVRQAAAEKAVEELLKYVDTDENFK
jgi:PncC family amidohydrolase